MAALQDDATLDFDDQNDVQIQFIDKEDFKPLIRSFILMNRN